MAEEKKILLEVDHLKKYFDTPRGKLHAVDDVSHTPEDKFSACQMERVADQQWAERHVAQEYADLKARLAKEASAQDVEPAVAFSASQEPDRILV